MPKFLCLQRAVQVADGAEKPSPAQMQAMYAKFNEWREKFEKNLTDPGGRLGKGRLVMAQPAPDGPLVEVKAQDPLRLRCPGGRPTALHKRSKRLQAPRARPQPVARGARNGRRPLDGAALDSPAGRPYRPLLALHRGVPLFAGTGSSRATSCSSAWRLPTSTV
jgi:hypothetical protein